MVKHNVLDKKDTGSKIRYYREREGWSREYVADAIQSNRKAVTAWEKGEYMPSLSNAVLLADLFDVYIEDLVVVYDYQMEEE